ncbi:hypothetical protein [Candidatus Enterococcus clewellii]|uniref:WxL domain-containing protein n=2 Tax=Candidatus Enterococcus clewellii TaxID=1834193 RepID=A0AAQ3VXY8_9ENTE
MRRRNIVTFVAVSVIGLSMIPFVAKAAGGQSFVQAPSMDIRDNLYGNIADGLSEAGEYNRLNDFKYVYEQYGVVPREYMDMVTHVDSDWEEPYLNGLEYAENLETLQGEFIEELQELSPIKDLVNLKSIWIEYGDNTNLKELKNLTSLETLRISSSGYSDRANDEGTDEKPDMLALYDISELSNLSSLNEIKIYTQGLLQTVTMKKGTTSYEMYSPVIKSEQFGDKKIEYSEAYSNGENELFTEQDSLLKWENIPSDAEHLSFSWNVSNGKSFAFNGEVLIPINWID